jgi:glycosyltransferase involved in cell wall biosynthesis
LGKQTKILLHVGRLGKEKAIDFIIDAFVQIQKKTPDSVLVLVGEGADKDILQERVDQVGLHDKVHFLGVFSPEKLPDIYTDADLFLFASQTETQGLVILEALASSLPIVAVKDNVFDGILEDGKNSYLVKKDRNVYADKVVKLLQDEKLRKEFAEQSLKSAQKFSIEKTAIELETIFEELIREFDQTPLSSRRKYLYKFHGLMKPFLLVRK